MECDNTKGKCESSDGRAEYKRDLGLIEAISIVIGKIIGSGIFRTPGPIMALVASTSLFGLVWALGGLVTIFGAVCYAELVAMIPESGGPYVYLRAAYPPVWAFLRGWAMFFVSESAAIAAVALVFSEYLNAFCNIIYGESYSHPWVIIIALACIWLLTFINFFGVHISGIVQNILSSLKVIAIGLIIGISFAAKGSFANFGNPFWPENFSWDSIVSIGAAMRYSFFAFSGWEGASYVAEEVKNPRRNLPLSLFFGIGGVMLLYAGANAAYIYQLTVQQIMESKSVAVDAMQMAFGSAGGIMLSIAVMLNTFGNVSTQILCKARSWQVMARDGLFFDKLAVLHPKYKSPNNSLIAQALWASVLLIFAAFKKNSYEELIAFFAATGAIFNIMTFTSVFVLRKKFPDMERPYKAWLYPYSLIGIIILYLIFLFITLWTAFIPSMLGLLMTSSGFIFYFWKKGKIFRKEVR